MKEFGASEVLIQNPPYAIYRLALVVTKKANRNTIAEWLTLEECENKADFEHMVFRSEETGLDYIQGSNSLHATCYDTWRDLANQALVPSGEPCCP